MNSEYHLFWITKSKDVYRQLKQEGRPVVMFNSFAGIMKQIRAKAVFSTVQFSDYNQWLLTDTIYIDLGHGHPIKDPGKNVMSSNQLVLQNEFVKNLHYYGIKASNFAKEKYQDVVKVSPDHIFISDFARNDVFVDAKLREGKNLDVEKKKKKKKAIVYMPTHRSDGKAVMSMQELLPLQDIQTFCETNGWVFLVKKHFYHRNECEDFSKYSNIYDITQLDDLDPQVLLYQADILISDYSACYIDYLLLDRPILFYQYDIDEYQKKERSLYMPFDKLGIAPISYTKGQLMADIIKVCQGGDEYREKRQAFTPTYFQNSHQENGREKVKKILDSLLLKYTK